MTTVKTKLIPFTLFFMVFAGFASCNNLQMDRSASANEASAETVVMEGFGQKSRLGYLFVQVNENDSTAGKFTVTIPMVDCKSASCVQMQFFRKDGSRGYAYNVPKGIGRVNFNLAHVLGHEGALTAADTGEYFLGVKVIFTGADNEEFIMRGRGFVRIDVVKEEFKPMACNDPNVVWTTKINATCEAQFSTAYRSALCGKGCK